MNLDPCPRPDCTFPASPENPTGHHWHNKPRMDAEWEQWHFDDLALPSAGDLCNEDADMFTRCYSARQPADRTTYRDAATGQYVTAEHAAVNPATTVREDDSRVRELQRRLDAVVALCIDGPHADDCDRDEGDRDLDPRCPACWTLNIRRALGVES